MRYRLPFLFSVTGTVRGGRKEQEVLFGDFLDVEIEELSASEIDRATSWEEPGGKVMGTWLHDGRHFAPVARLSVFGYALGGFNEIDMAWCHAVLDGSGADGMWNYRSLLAGENRKVPAWSPSSMRAISASGRDEAIAEAAARASRIISVEGKPFMEVPEPTYQFRLPEDPSQLSITGAQASVEPFLGEPMRPGYVRRPFIQPVFRADRYDDMIDYARARFGPEVQIRECSRIDILAPEAIAFDDDAWTVIETARDVLPAVLPLIGTKSYEEAEAWFALRDAVGGHEEADRVAEAMQRLADTVPGTTPAEEMADALRRWDLRPIPQSGLSV